jgi:hypothetical protein
VSTAAALILALMIDPAAAERALLAAPTAAPERPPPPRAPEAVVVATPPSPPPSMRGFARLFGGAVALFPTPEPAAGVAVGARRRRLAAELSFLATGEHRLGGAGGEGDFRLLAGGARACGTLGGHAVVWQLCAGGELDRLTGTGLAAPGLTESTLMGAATAGALVTVPLGARFGLTLGVDGALRLYHPEFQASGTRVFQVPALGAMAALGVVITI